MQNQVLVGRGLGHQPQRQHTFDTVPFARNTALPPLSHEGYVDSAGSPSGSSIKVRKHRPKCAIIIKTVIVQVVLCGFSGVRFRKYKYRFQLNTAIDFAPI